MSIENPNKEKAHKRRLAKAEKEFGVTDKKALEDLVGLKEDHARVKFELRRKERELLKERADKIEAQVQSFTDALTRLPNRLRIEMDLQRRCELLDDPVSTYKRKGEDKSTDTIPQNKFSVMFIDVDAFKPINDTLGHDVGDETLMRIADIIRSRVRSDDLPGRWGGDEFTILVNEKVGGNTGAKILATDIIDGIHEINNELLMNYGFKGQLGASIGICSSDEYDGSPERLIQMADRAMYKAKETGKNNIEIATTHEY